MDKIKVYLRICGKGNVVPYEFSVTGFMIKPATVGEVFRLYDYRRVER